LTDRHILQNFDITSLINRLAVVCLTFILGVGGKSESGQRRHRALYTGPKDHLVKPRIKPRFDKYILNQSEVSTRPGNPIDTSCSRLQIFELNLHLRGAAQMLQLQLAD
jgi:hypothetical protein